MGILQDKTAKAVPYITDADVNSYAFDGYFHGSSDLFGLHYTDAPKDYQAYAEALAALFRSVHSKQYDLLNKFGFTTGVYGDVFNLQYGRFLIRPEHLQDPTSPYGKLFFQIEPISKYFFGVNETAKELSRYFNPPAGFEEVLADLVGERIEFKIHYFGDYTVSKGYAPFPGLEYGYFYTDDYRERYIINGPWSPYRAGAPREAYWIRLTDRSIQMLCGLIPGPDSVTKISKKTLSFCAFYHHISKYFLPEPDDGDPKTGGGFTGLPYGGLSYVGATIGNGETLHRNQFDVIEESGVYSFDELDKIYQLNKRGTDYRRIDPINGGLSYSQSYVLPKYFNAPNPFQLLSHAALATEVTAAQAGSLIQSIATVEAVVAVGALAPIAGSAIASGLGTGTAASTAIGGVAAQNTVGSLTGKNLSADPKNIVTSVAQDSGVPTTPSAALNLVGQETKMTNILGFDVNVDANNLIGQIQSTLPDIPTDFIPQSVQDAASALSSSVSVTKAPTPPQPGPQASKVVPAHAVATAAKVGVPVLLLGGVAAYFLLFKGKAA